MNKEKTIILKGISRTPYDFDIYSWGTPFSTLSAMYIVLKRIEPGYSIIFIGHTSDLSRCFDNHELQTCLDREGKTHVGLMPVPSVTKRMSIETDLIASYAPVCNSFVIEEDRENYRIDINRIIISPIDDTDNNEEYRVQKA